MRRALFRQYWRVERLIAPTLQRDEDPYEAVLKRDIPQGARWLDIGCGHTLLPPWRAELESQLVSRAHTVIGIDQDLNALKRHPSILSRVRGDIENLPFKGACFNVVTANMVVEHLASPSQQFKEINRVLFPGGLFIFHTPNLLGYATLLALLIPEALKKKLIWLLQGRTEEDVFGTYYRSNTHSRIGKLAHRCGFEVADLQMIVGSAITATLPPLYVFELLWIRLLMTRLGKPFRPNIIAVLRKTSG